MIGSYTTSKGKVLELDYDAQLDSRHVRVGFAYGEHSVKLPVEPDPYGAVLDMSGVIDLLDEHVSDLTVAELRELDQALYDLTRPVGRARAAQHRLTNGSLTR